MLLGITDLGINLPVLLGQTLSFTFLLIVLRLMVYKPVLKMLDERRERSLVGRAQPRDQVRLLVGGDHVR